MGEKTFVFNKNTERKINGSVNCVLNVPHLQANTSVERYLNLYRSAARYISNGLKGGTQADKSALKILTGQRLLSYSKSGFSFCHLLHFWTI